MIPHWVKPYIGLPFRLTGRDRRGIDCYGLVALVYQEVLCVTLPDFIGRYEDARDQTRSHLFLEGCADNCWTPCERPSMFNVVVLDAHGLPAHCGIVVNDRQMLHITDAAGSCVERFDGPMWSSRIHGFYRYRAADNE